jgi:DNA-binding protein Fis
VRSSTRSRSFKQWTDTFFSAGPISREEVLALLPKTRSSLQTGDHTHLSLEEIERLLIQRVLDASSGNKTQAAKTLQIDYKTLLTKLKKYGLAT